MHPIHRAFPTSRRPCGENHRIGRSFAGGPAPGACDAWCGNSVRRLCCR